ncbi:Flp pilus assembly protein protease CpaA [Acetoanaerobium pronyense]|uniref:Flp pilus assembly protein protease CpaA n=1 Tax=Acetoanaerobium pronyense TaxID=1482736 RepID=A0ABS4KNU4_9FIRM|nr:prepilin peptidase [Acetoanaerobium pronyense]MBP2028294.1 Flp pilus assembly protein protease CpaA [Acetoanaerobium pronyense]
MDLIKVSCFLILISILGIISIVDLKTRKIPNKYIIILMAIWVPFAYFKILDSNTAIYGFAIGGFLLYFTALVTRGGIGGGDVKLVAVSGLYVGFPGIMYATVYGFGLAALYSIILMGLKKIGKKDFIPLGPFISIGVIIQFAILYII